ncbi:hypothetical protein HZS_5361, partial [Henneguya salminicola]
MLDPSDVLKNFSLIFDISKNNEELIKNIFYTNDVYSDMMEMNVCIDKYPNIDDESNYDLLKFYQSQLHKLKKTLNNDVSILRIIAYIFLACAIIRKNMNITLYETAITETEMFEILSRYPSHPFALSLFLCQNSIQINQNKFNEVIQILTQNFRNENRLIRLLTIHILSNLEPNDSLLFKTFLKIETMSPDFNSYKTRTMLLVNLSNLIDVSYLDLSISLKIYIYFLVSHYSINLNLIWPIIDDILQDIYNKPRYRTAFSLIWFHLFSLAYEFLISSYQNNISNKDTFFIYFELQINAHEKEIKKNEGNKITLWRSILKITDIFKNVVSLNSIYIFNQLEYLTNNAPNDCTLSKTHIDYFYTDNHNNNLYLWKELVIISVKCLGSVKNLESLTFSSELYKILLKIIPVPLIDVSRSCIKCIIHFKNIMNFEPDNILTLYDMDYSGINHKISYLATSAQGYPRNFDILIRVLFSRVLAKKINDNSSRLFVNLLNHSNLDSDSFKGEFFLILNEILQQFSPDISLFIHYKLMLKFLDIIHNCIQGFGLKIAQHFNIILPSLFYIGRCCNNIYRDDSVINKYKNIYKNIWKNLIRLISSVLKLSVDLKLYIYEFETIFIESIIDTHRNNDLSQSLFPDLIYG